MASRSGSSTWYCLFAALLAAVAAATGAMLIRNRSDQQGTVVPGTPDREPADLAVAGAIDALEEEETSYEDAKEKMKEALRILRTDQERQAEVTKSIWP